MKEVRGEGPQNLDSSSFTPDGLNNYLLGKSEGSSRYSVFPGLYLVGSRPVRYHHKAREGESRREASSSPTKPHPRLEGGESLAVRGGGGPGWYGAGWWR